MSRNEVGKGGKHCKSGKNRYKGIRYDRLEELKGS